MNTVIVRVLVSSLLLVMACAPPDAEITLVRMDLETCLGDRVFEDATPSGAAFPATCRGSIAPQIDTDPEAAANVCLVLRTTGNDTQRVGFRWQTEPSAPHLGYLDAPLSNIMLPPGRTVAAALFFLSEGGSEAVCDALEYDTPCTAEANCVLRIFEDEVTPDSEGATVVTFSTRGTNPVCQAEQGPQLQAQSELCDQIDNDCDGTVDEGFRQEDRSAPPFLGGGCEMGVGACTTAGEWVCNQTGDDLACDAVPGVPQDEVCNPAGSSERERDDDCDGTPDEDLPCFDCEQASDCSDVGHPAGAFCIGGHCAECDPNSEAHSGCGTNQLCCLDGTTPFCTDTTPDQCTQCNGLGDEGSCSSDANVCDDRTCICANQGAACNASAPLCVDGSCIQCRDDNDCGPGALCCDNQCIINDFETQCESCGQGCDPANSDRCENRQCVCGPDGDACDGDRQFCDVLRADGPICQQCRDDDDCDGVCIFDGRDSICVDCTTDNNCQGNPAGSQCVDNQCVQCDPSDPSYAPCDPNGLTPICKQGPDGPRCEACERDIECSDNPTALAEDFLAPQEGQTERLNFCVQGRCRVCDTDDDNGCSIPTRPICTGVNDIQPNPDGEPVSQFVCRGCQADDECGELGNCIVNEGRCTGCRPEDDQGCRPLSGTPICDPVSISCVGCSDDAQCPAGQDVPNSPRVLCVVLDEQLGGSCRECDSRNNRGCNIASPRPFCDGSGVCRACDVSEPDGGDSECALHSNMRRECVGGSCEVCDALDNSGCNLQSGSPVCRADRTCGACVNDGECRRGLSDADAAITFCEDGRCVGCERGTNAGCDPAGPLPICSVDGQCRPCVPGECPNDGQCVQGRCLQCDPATHAGCGEGTAQPICGQNGICGACVDDLDCLRRPGDRDECLGGRCRICDPNDNAGCNSNRPVCDAERFECRGCGFDGECDDGLCLVGEGLCAECDPNTQRGCDLNSNAPFCDPDERRCRACGVDAECTVQGQGRCVQGACRECDFRDHADCDEFGPSPICGFEGACRECRLRAECILRGATGQECVDGSCVECEPNSNAGCDDAERPICAGDPPSCRGCADDAECPEGTVCAGDGQCVGCDPNIQNACPAALPVCDLDDRTCRPCTGSEECGGECVNGRCEDCNPITNAGCDLAAANPVCQNDSRCGACENDAQCAIFGAGLDYCIEGRCRSCEPGNGNSCPTAQAPVCTDNFVCAPCGAGAPCLNNLQCVNGQCRECAPDGQIPEAGCDAADPVCDRANDGVDAEPFTCRGCSADAECGAGQCVDGRCVECDPADNAGCGADAEPVCSAGNKACRGCQNSAECLLLRPDQPVCDAGTGRCVECLPDGNVGCGGAEPICNPNTFTCEPCQGVGQGNCGAGRQCVNGSCSGCNPQNNSGCDSQNPICDPNDFECGPCRIDEDCVDGVCIGGACVACNVENQAGCLASQLCCLVNDVPVCVDTSADGDCTDCGSRCDADTANLCVGRTCACGDQPPCEGATPFCVGEGAAGACVACRGNDDCDPTGNRPFCDPQVGQCVGCDGDSNRCIGNPQGPVCVTDGPSTDECRGCDPGRPTGINGCASEGIRPVCHPVLFECARCTSADDCAGNVNGQACVTGGGSRGACRSCDANAEFGETTCAPESDTPVCGAAFECRGCQDDPECAASQRGLSCLDSGACGCEDDGDCDGIGDGDNVCVEGVCQ